MASSRASPACARRTAARGAPRSSAPSDLVERRVRAPDARVRRAARRARGERHAGADGGHDARRTRSAARPCRCRRSRRIASSMPSPAVRLSVRNSSTVGSSAEMRASRRRAPRCSIQSRSDRAECSRRGTAWRRARRGQRGRTSARAIARAAPRDERRRPPRRAARRGTARRRRCEPAWRSRARSPRCRRATRRRCARSGCASGATTSAEHRARVGGRCGEQRPRLGARCRRRTARPVRPAAGGRCAGPPRRRARGRARGRAPSTSAEQPASRSAEPSPLLGQAAERDHRR